MCEMCLIDEEWKTWKKREWQFIWLQIVPLFNDHFLGNTFFFEKTRASRLTGTRQIGSGKNQSIRLKKIGWTCMIFIRVIFVDYSLLDFKNLIPQCVFLLSLSTASRIKIRDYDIVYFYHSIDDLITSFDKARMHFIDTLNSVWSSQKNPWSSQTIKVHPLFSLQPKFQRKMWIKK